MATPCASGAGGQVQGAIARRIPVVIGADAHRPDRVGDNYVGAMRILRSVGYREIHFFLERRRQTVSIADALASLGEPA